MLIHTVPDNYTAWMTGGREGGREREEGNAEDAEKNLECNY